LSVTLEILSDARFAPYTPVDVRESAPRTTPPSYTHAMIVVCGRGREGGEGRWSADVFSFVLNSPQIWLGRRRTRDARRRRRRRRTPVEMPPLALGSTPSSGGTP
jgi:NAD(P)H-hydrate repair Nnr-like enzyme with NAD(P)H-hydrate epimerase domain